jgi:hypothetical protein
VEFRVETPAAGGASCGGFRLEFDFAENTLLRGPAWPRPLDSVGASGLSPPFPPPDGGGGSGGGGVVLWKAYWLSDADRETLEMLEVEPTSARPASSTRPGDPGPAVNPACRLPPDHAGLPP